MSLGETFSRLLLKRLVDDVFTTGGVEALDTVIDFLTRCGQQRDPRLTAALEHAMHRAWRTLEATLTGEPSQDHCQPGLAPRHAQALRQCLERVLAELAHGGVAGTATVSVVANGLRRQCLDDLRSARSGGALAGCLDHEEWARSQEVFVGFAVEQGRRETRRRTEGQFLRELEEHGCVGLMRILTAGAGLPLLMTAARAFLCQELADLLYRCLQECPHQPPDNCTLLRDILHELSTPCFSVWRSPAVPAKPVHWSRLESGSDVRSPHGLSGRRFGNPSAKRRSQGNPPSILRFQQILSHFQQNRRTAGWPRASWILASLLAIAVVLLVVLPIWLLAADGRRQEDERQRMAMERQRLRAERHRVEAERQQLIDAQRRIAREELARQQEFQRHRELAEHQRRLEAEEQRRQAQELALQRREEQRRRLAAEQQTLLREQQQRLERARVALEDGLRLSAYGKDREALTVLSEALELDPSLNRGWSARGKVQRRLGDLAAALRDYQEAVRRDPRDVRSRFQCGELHRANHDYRQAIVAFTIVLRLEPDNVEAYRQRGLCHASNGDLDNALADQTKAIDLVPNDPWAYFYRAEVHRQRGRREPAFADYTAAIERDHVKDRGLAGAYRGRGLLSLHQRQYRRAIRDLTQALELDPADRETQRARGLAYLRCGEWNKALLDAEELLAHDPDDSAAYKLRGQAYMGLRQYRKAHDDFTRALRKGRDAETYYLRARVKAHLGDINEAIFDCNDATALNPNLASAFYLRAQLYLSEGYRPIPMAGRRSALEARSP